MATPISTSFKNPFFYRADALSGVVTTRMPGPAAKQAPTDLKEGFDQIIFLKRVQSIVTTTGIEATTGSPMDRHAAVELNGYSYQATHDRVFTQPPSISQLR